MQKWEQGLASGFWIDFRRFFVRGLAAVLPAVVTIMIIVWVFGFIHDHIGRYINDGVVFLLGKVAPRPDPDYWPNWWDRYWYVQGVGFVLAIIGIYFVGRFLASFVGRSLWSVLEHGLGKTPLVKLIYPNVKQVTDFLLSEPRLTMSRVVAVEYPRKGIWSLGLVTGEGAKALEHALDSQLLTVFVPSSPTPVTGYTICVRRDEVIDMPWTIDEALRFTVSGGVLQPVQRLPSPDLPTSATAPAQANHLKEPSEDGSLRSNTNG